MLVAEPAGSVIATAPGPGRCARRAAYPALKRASRGGVSVQRPPVLAPSVSASPHRRRHRWPPRRRRRVPISPEAPRGASDVGASGRVPRRSERYFALGIGDHSGTADRQAGGDRVRSVAAWG